MPEYMVSFFKEYYPGNDNLSRLHKRFAYKIGSTLNKRGKNMQDVMTICGATSAGTLISGDTRIEGIFTTTLFDQECYCLVTNTLRSL